MRVDMLTKSAHFVNMEAQISFCPLLWEDCHPGWKVIGTVSEHVRTYVQPALFLGSCTQMRVWKQGYYPYIDKSLETRLLSIDESLKQGYYPYIDESLETRLLSIDESLGTRLLSIDESLGTRLLSIDESLGTRLLSIDESLGTRLLSIYRRESGNKATIHI